MVTRWDLRGRRRGFRTVGVGFTLIELLVVVAIIAILVAVMLNNFKSAQIKAKVARVEGDLHTLALAAYQYRMDNGVYMKAQCGVKASHTNACLLNVLSSPIAYISASESVDDPFQKASWALFRRQKDPREIIDHDRERGQRYGWYETASMRKEIFQKSMKYGWNKWQGAPVPGSFDFILVSRGPDLIMNIDEDDNAYFKKLKKYWEYNDVFITYDPTNGLTSWGDIYRCGP